MAKWAIQTTDSRERHDHYEYYTGGSYVFQEERYVVSSKDKREAKTYTSQKRALSAMYKIEYNFNNSERMRVVEIPDTTQGG